MAYRIHIQGFRYRADPYVFTIRHLTSYYTFSIQPRDGIEDFGPALAAILAIIDPASNPLYTVNTDVAAVLTSELKLYHISYLGVMPTVVTEEDGTEIFQERAGSATPEGTRQLALVDGICAARGRLAAWTYENVIHWSSVVDPMDFTPSISTQANELRIKALLGKIIKCLPHKNGFIIYATGNIIKGDYIGGQEVFGFEAISAEGIIDPRYADNAGDKHIAWTAGGLQMIDGVTGKIDEALMELTDFLHNFVQPVKIQILNGRYMVINLRDTTDLGISNTAIVEGTANAINLGEQVNQTNYTANPVEIASSDSYIPVFPLYKYGLIFDFITQRWGCINKDYLALGSMNPINQQGYKMEKNQPGTEGRYNNGLKGLIAFDANSRLSICNDNEPTAYLRFGNFRLNEGNGHTQINKVSVEYADYADAAITVIGSDDGRLLDPASAMTSVKQATPGFDNFFLTMSKVWFNIIVSGKFHLTQLTIEAHKNGS